MSRPVAPDSGYTLLSSLVCQLKAKNSTCACSMFYLVDPTLSGVTCQTLAEGWQLCGAMKQYLTLLHYSINRRGLRYPRNHVIHRAQSMPRTFDHKNAVWGRRNAKKWREGSLRGVSEAGRRSAKDEHSKEGLRRRSRREWKGDAGCADASGILA